MKQNLSAHGELVIQAMLTTDLLLHLAEWELLKSDYFINKKPRDEFFYEYIQKVTIGNQGTALMGLYALLVIPRETIFDLKPSPFLNFNKDFLTIYPDASATSSYPEDHQVIDFARHLRNAVSHGRANFVESSHAMEFEDVGRNKNHKCTITVPMNCFPAILAQLRKIVFDNANRLG